MRLFIHLNSGIEAKLTYANKISKEFFNNIWYVIITCLDFYGEKLTFT